MDKKEVTATVKTIMEQLVGTTNRNVLFSWGILRCEAILFKNMATLQLKVDARLFSGYVLISYNAGSDYYEIYLKKGEEVRCVSERSFFDEMGEIIDREIESGTNAEEYNKFCENELYKLISGEYSD